MIARRIREAIALGTAAGLLGLGCHTRADGHDAGSALPREPPADSDRPVEAATSIPETIGRPGSLARCFTHDGAIADAVGEERDPVVGCPALVMPESAQRPVARGVLDVTSTTARRAKAGARADECCYEMSLAGNRGRPFLVDGRATRAAVQPAGPFAPEAKGWLAAAQAEHASIASFARSLLELMAVGAPLDLLEASQAALGDEIRHARVCLDLAAKEEARVAFELGPLPALAPRGGGLARVALDTFDEGCVAETLAAIEAQRVAAACTCPTTRALLQRIADDEVTHAALAWRTLAWALAAAGPSALPGLLRERATLRYAALPSAAREAWDEVVAPSLAALAAARAELASAARIPSSKDASD